MKHLTLLPLCVSLVTAAACAQTDFSHDKTPPTLTLTSPERGLMAATGGITVTGTAIDDDAGVTSVTVNGVQAKLAANGEFTATVDVASGVQLIETIAVDRGGNQRKDVRAVMTGTLAKVTDEVQDAVVARLGTSALTNLGSQLGKQATAMDFTALAKAANPLAQSGGSCLGYTANLESIQKGGVRVGLLAKDGALDTQVGIDQLAVRVKVNFKVACIGGSSPLTLSARTATVTGALQLAARNGTLTSAVNGADIVFADLNVDASGIPGAVIDLFQDRVNNAARDAVRDAVRNALPQLITSELASLTGQSLEQPLLGEQLKIALATDTIALSPAGLRIGLRGKMLMGGNTAATYVANPESADAALAAAGDHAGVGFADDLFNQLFAGAWAVGALDTKFAFGPELPVGALFGDTAAGLSLKLLLPPTLSADTNGKLALTIGDALVEIYDTNAQALAQFTVSMQVPISVGGNGTSPTLNLDKPLVTPMILGQSPDLPRELTEDLITGVVELAASQLTGKLTTAVRTLPLPLQQYLSNVALAAEHGYLLVTAAIAP